VRKDTPPGLEDYPKGARGSLSALLVILYHPAAPVAIVCRLQTSASCEDVVVIKQAAEQRTPVCGEGWNLLYA